METLEALHLIDRFLGSDATTAEIQRLRDGWHIIQHVPSGVTEQRTIRFAGREQTFEAPVYQRETLINTPSIADAAQFVVQQKAGKSVEEYQAEWEERRKAHSSIPIVQDILSAPIRLDDYIVPWEYVYSPTMAEYSEPCSNCDGVGVFLDRECIFCRDDPTDTCARCGGLGRSDHDCPICRGAGTIPGILIARFVNQETGERLAIRIGGPFLPLFSAYLHMGYEGNPWERTYLHIVVELERLFEQITERLGVSEETHVVEWLGRVSVRNWQGPLNRMQLDRIELPDSEDPEIPEGSAETWLERTQQGFARIVSHYRNDPYIQEKAEDLGVDAATWTFIRKRPFDEAFEELYRRAEARGYGIAIITRFYETGIHPLAVDLTDADGLEHLVQLGHDYSLEASVHQALRVIDAAMDKADRDRS